MAMNTKEKVYAAKKKLKAKAESNRNGEEYSEPRLRGDGGPTAKIRPTAKIPGAEKNAPLTDWEKKYGSKK